MTSKEIRERRSAEYPDGFWLKQIALQLAEINEFLMSRPGEINEEDIAWADKQIERLSTREPKNNANLFPDPVEALERELAICQDNYGVMKETLGNALQTIQKRNERIAELEAQIETPETYEKDQPGLRRGDEQGQAEDWIKRTNFKNR